MFIVPVIDLADARSGAGGKSRVARQIDDANRDIGFLVLINHDISPELIDRLYAVSADFFDLPVSVKNNYAIGSRSLSRGYVPPKIRALANTRGGMTAGDLVELYAAGLPEVPKDPYFEPQNAGINFRPNIWPVEIENFQKTWTEYYTAMESLSAEVMSLFALALDLDADYFSAKIDKHISNLFANHYPPILEKPEDGQIRVGEHTDYGSLTLLLQRDEVGGLEVFVDGVWQPVAPTPGAFVINIGDLMARWTNDRWISTLHRVQNPPADRLHMRRISFPFFCQPNYDTLIEAFPSCVDATHPARYAPITSGENMQLKTDQSFSPSSSKVG